MSFNFFVKYFCEGQATHMTLEVQNGKTQNTKKADTFLERNRKVIGMSIPIIIVHTVWWSYMITNDRFSLFNGKAGANGIPRWYMSITMIFGSMLAGATSEGGAAVAFPVMTLVFGISPIVARDFSFLIQSVGMTAAAGVILWMRVLIEMKSLIYCTIGGTIGIIIGLEYIDLEPPYAKMYFVVIWGAFAASLFYLNRTRHRKVYLVTDPPHLPIIWKDAIIFQLSTDEESILSYFTINWKACVLILTGFLGGIFSSISGSGIDICSFACLTLLFRVSEKTATPTSVVLMAINTMVGFLYRQYGQGGIESDAYGFFLVCAPIVCFGAPFGSVVGSYVHRLVLAWAIYVTDSVQLIAALIIVEPWVKQKGKPGFETPMHLTLSSAAIFISGLVFFYILQLLGQLLIDRNDKLELQFSNLNQHELLDEKGLGFKRADELMEKKKHIKDISEIPNIKISDNQKKVIQRSDVEIEIF
mmetsp:Transcript_6798/g.8768  ORF Transcript_6798/g.8768 Transcript_6798/m.8768 type:complete len:473 (+) Transcript_6798:139-1557(+)